jgi:hypothetical protein
VPPLGGILAMSLRLNLSAALVTATIAASFYLGCSADNGVESSAEELSSESLEELKASVTEQAMQRAPRNCDCGGGGCCCDVDIPAPWDIHITSCCSRASCVTF